MDSNFAIFSITHHRQYPRSSCSFQQMQKRIQFLSRCSPQVGYFALHHDQWRTTHNVRIHERVVVVRPERRIQQTSNNKPHLLQFSALAIASFAAALPPHSRSSRPAMQVCVSKFESIASNNLRIII